MATKKTPRKLLHIKWPRKKLVSNAVEKIPKVPEKLDKAKVANQVGQAIDAG